MVKYRKMKRAIFQLFGLRWNIQLLAALYELDGAKFITLASKLGTSRSVLSSTLKQLIRGGLVRPNPGYGHPLRPEYILTSAGRTAAPFCKELVDVAASRKEKYLLQSKWALPVLFAGAEETIRFSELKSRLAPITPRALSVELKTLTQMGYIRRRVVEEFPPVSIYLLTGKGREYAAIFQKHLRVLALLPEGRPKTTIRRY